MRYKYRWIKVWAGMVNVMKKAVVSRLEELERRSPVLGNGNGASHVAVVAKMRGG
jgi:hypothetical protein